MDRSFVGIVKESYCIRRSVSGGEQPDGYIHGMQPCADTPYCGIMMVKTGKRPKNDAKRKNVPKTVNPPILLLF